jgi:hypothetical protein
MKLVASLVLGLTALWGAAAFDYGLVQTDEESVRVFGVFFLLFTHSPR